MDNMTDLQVKRRIKAFEKLERMTKRPKGVRQYYNPMTYLYLQHGLIYLTNSFLVGRVEFGKRVLCQPDLVVAKLDYNNGFIGASETDPLRDNVDNLVNLLRREMNDCQCNMFNQEMLSWVISFFGIYGINPTIYMSGECIDISGHDDNVSAVFRVMGMR